MIDDGWFTLTKGRAGILQRLSSHHRILEHLCHSLRKRRPGQHGIDRHAGAGDVLGKPACDAKSRRLGEAAVDHVGGNVQRRLRGDEDDAAPSSVDHRRQIGARQAHAGHDIRLEKTEPFAVGNLEKVLFSVDSEVVDEHIANRVRRDENVAAACILEVRDKAGHLGALADRAEGLDSPVDALSGATVDDDARARSRESLGCREADSGGRSGDDGGLVGFKPGRPAHPRGLLRGHSAYGPPKVGSAPDR
jgi:hypothetical protein